MMSRSAILKQNLVEQSSVANALQFTFLAILCSALLVALVGFLLRWPMVPWISLIAAALTAVAIALHRSGYTRSGVFLSLMGIGYAIMQAAAVNDGIQNIGLAIVPALIVIASLVLDRLSLILFTTGALLTTVAMLAIRYYVLRPETYNRNELGDFIVFAVTCTTAAVVGRILSTGIARGLQQEKDRLAEAEERLRLLIENAPAAIAMFDTEMRYIGVSRRWRMQYLDGVEGVLGQSDYELFPQCPERWRAAHRKGLAGEIIRVEEDVWVREDGTELWARYEVLPWRAADGDIAGIIIFTEDITDRKQSEAVLRESEERFRTLADTAPVMIWVSGPDKGGTFFNKAWLDFTGRTMEQEVGEGWINAVHPDDLEHCLGTCGTSFEERRAFQLQFRLRRADGEYRWIVDTGVPRYQHGEFIGYIGSCLDVTDARRVQAESFARQKLESLGTLASGIAHDFNNLLGGVLAQAELAEEELAAGSEPREELKSIRDAAIRGSEIVRQLLIYAGKESDVLEPVDISSSVEEMLGLLKASVSKHATLVTDLREDLPAVRARAAQIRQILMNLVVNASDAIRTRDGVIRVATDHVTVDRHNAAAVRQELSEGDYVRLEVSDTGSGMSQETQGRMFDPFFSTKSAGRGLGLAVIHGIVRGLRGAIHVSSELGKGSTFQVLLPSAGTPTGRSDTDGGVAQALPLSPKGTVLVVEDESSLRLAVSKILGKSGFTVFEADDGSKAIEVLRAKAGEVDVLFLDMTLPGSPSDEVFAEALRSRLDMKVILTSAYSEEMVKETLSAPQVFRFIRKPFQLGTVAEAVRSALLS